MPDERDTIRRVRRAVSEASFRHSREILFLVSQEAAAQFKDWDVDWSEASKGYRDEMHKRVQDALVPGE